MASDKEQKFQVEFSNAHERRLTKDFNSGQAQNENKSPDNDGILNEPPSNSLDIIRDQEVFEFYSKRCDVDIEKAKERLEQKWELHYESKKYVGSNSFQQKAREQDLKMKKAFLENDIAERTKKIELFYFGASREELQRAKTQNLQPVNEKEGPKLVRDMSQKEVAKQIQQIDEDSNATSLSEYIKELSAKNQMSKKLDRGR
jgi:hypothetical protein